MRLAHVSRHKLRPVPMPPSSPIVFVVDDDISVRESLELLIEHEGWRAKMRLRLHRNSSIAPAPVSRVASYLTFLFPVSMASNCRSELQSNAPTCRSSLSPVTAMCRRRCRR